MAAKVLGFVGILLLGVSTATLARYIDHNPQTLPKAMAHFSGVSGEVEVIAFHHGDAVEDKMEKAGLKRRHFIPHPRLPVEPRRTIERGEAKGGSADLVVSANDDTESALSKAYSSGKTFSQVSVETRRHGAWTLYELKDVRITNYRTFSLDNTIVHDIDLDYGHIRWHRENRQLR